ncbi:hypothetical protein CCAX7_27980 [Capsulimonas corticalis]|uniref:Uncharacterized protein n=1 Tax=Capsulimonas corticalis TaxID=2219043 RepID=A0A402CTF0_9BACT|nr:hypothetical protein [Capsulimonas corticalis]BDI30747.1 hypothetical protein CCAX7_27980 [Capsulimonas corticalis]
MPITVTGHLCSFVSVFAFAAAPVFAQDVSPPPKAPLSPTVLPPGPSASLDGAAHSSDAATMPSAVDTPEASKPKKHHSFPRIGVDYGTFAPADHRTKDAFGGAWTSIGLGIGAVKQPLSHGKLSFDLSIYSKKSGDTHAFMAPVGIEYRRALIPYAPGHRPSLLPYAGLTLDYVATDLCVPKDDVHSRFRFTEGGSVFLGATVGGRGFVEWRYLGIGKVRGFNLSGVKFDAGIRF